MQLFQQECLVRNVRPSMAAREILLKEMSHTLEFQYINIEIDFTLYLKQVTITISHIYIIYLVII